MDGSRGGDTSLKAAELADVEEAAQKATSSQLASLAQAGEALQNASEEEKTGGQKTEKEKAPEKTANQEKDTDRKDTAADVSAEGTQEAETEFTYHPVDVRL